VDCSSRKLWSALYLTTGTTVGVLQDDLLHETDQNHAQTPAQQLSVALRFYVRASFQMDIGDMCGVSQATVCRAVHRVTAAICARKACRESSILQMNVCNSIIWRVMVPSGKERPHLRGLYRAYATAFVFLTLW
jgi:hypothetical protein